MKLKEAAKKLKSKGRNGDTILAHINPEEAAYLKSRGASGRPNPNTGLPEFGGYEGEGTNMDGGFNGGEFNGGDFGFNSDVNAFSGGIGGGGANLGQLSGGPDLGLASLGDGGSVASGYAGLSDPGSLTDAGGYTSPNQLGGILSGVGKIAGALNPTLGTMFGLGGKMADKFAPEVTNPFDMDTAMGRTGNYYGGGNSGAARGGESVFATNGFGGNGNSLATLYSSAANTGGGTLAYSGDPLSNQIRSLEEMFGQNSPYALQLRKQLEARDAAGGRRSQYGPREVELQAALAGKGIDAARTIGSLVDTQNTIYNRNRTGDQAEQKWVAEQKAAGDVRSAQQLSAIYRGGSAIIDAMSPSSSSGGNIVSKIFSSIFG